MPTHYQDLAGLLAHARGQAGVVSLAELRAYGFSTHAVSRRVASGTWSRIGNAIVIPAASAALPRTPASASDRQLAWAMQITFGPAAIVSGALAMRFAGWHLPTESCVVAMPRKPTATLGGVSVIRRPVTTVVRRPDGLRIAPAKEAFVDTLITEPAHSRHGLIDAALQQRLVTPESFRRWIEPRVGRGHKGAGILRGALARMSTGSRSEAEQRMSTLLARSRTGPWLPNHPVHDQRGRVIAEIDFADVVLRIAIEVDGRAHHSDRRAFERDRARQNDVMLQGWLVLRFTWEQITGDPAGVIATIHGAVRQRSAA